MYTVTFYSYRGGVGRTTALVNVALDLVRRGRKVLLVDFDLEAPGLPMRYEEGAHLGLVEFIAEYLRSGKAPDIRDHVYKAKPPYEDCADIWVMPAGRAHDGYLGDHDYWRTLQGINWKELYDHQDGYILFEDLKYQWQESFQPDYVLIDARAGINDRLAIYTRQLPDAVVMMLTPNYYYSVPEAPDEPMRYVLCGSDCEGSSAALPEPAERVMRDIITESIQSNPPRIDLLTVASNVPTDLEGEYLGVVLHYFVDPAEDDEFSYDLAATIPFAPESLFDFNRQGTVGSVMRKRLSQAYRRLANAIIRSNCIQEREGARAFLKELQLHPERALAELPDEPREFRQSRWLDRSAKLDQIINNFDRDPEILAQASSCLFLAGRYDRAMETLDRAVEIAPSSDTILWHRASYRRRLGDRRAVDDLLLLLDLPATKQSLLSPALQGEKWRDPQSPELDTTPLNTADPLETDFAGINPYVASAFQRLRQLAPEKEQQALQKSRIQQLSPTARQALVENTPFRPGQPDDLVWLVRNQKWQTLISRLAPRVALASRESCGDLFCLAMAYWGSGNDARSIALCQSARELMLRERDLSSMPHNYDADDLPEIPGLSLLFWRAGDAVMARKLLDRCDELFASFPEDNLFSYWRFCFVKRDLFQEDCESLRKMVESKADIRPAFLGKESR